MATRITVSGERDFAFPRACMVCHDATAGDYHVVKTFTIGQVNYDVTFDVPLCAKHLEAAERKNRAETLVEHLGFELGFAAGALTLGGLVFYWYQSGQPINPGSLFIAVLAGAAIFVTVWAAIALFVAPLFGDADSKQARSAVRAVHYWPASGDIMFEFASDESARLFAQANPGATTAS